MTTHTNKDGLTLTFSFPVLFVFFCFHPWMAAEAVNPFPRPVIASDPAFDWTFENTTCNFEPLHQCTLTAGADCLSVRSTGTDPYFAGPAISLQGPACVTIDMRTAASPSMQLFYATDQSPNFNEKMSVVVKINPDANWHTYELVIPTEDQINRIRIDPGAAEGIYEFRSIKVIRQHYHPLEIAAVKTSHDTIDVTIKNHGDTPQPFRMDDKKATLSPGDETTVTLQSQLAGRCFAQQILSLEADGLPPIKRSIFLYDLNAPGDFVTLSSGLFSARIETSGHYAQLQLNHKTVAVLAPIVHQQGRLPEFTLQPATEKNQVRFQGRDITLALHLTEDAVQIDIDSSRPCEGPVVRPIGNLEQGLFSGLEYLGKNERSSTRLDIETDGSLRFAPDVMQVTMPLMACVTDNAAIGFLWENMTHQPTYAVPNFVDGTEDDRMSLEGQSMRVRLLVKKDGALEDVIYWALKEHPLPPVPQRPRTFQAQKQLSLDCLNGPDRSDKGWAHCVEDHWPRAPFCDQASTVWRLTGQLPEFERYQLGGAHIRNEAIYFVTGAAGQWLNLKKAQIESFIHTQQPDGSFRYDGPYRRGHFEDTASGYCAWRAVLMTESAWLTGDQDVKKAAVKTLDYMKRFRTPRGAQTWEVPLHTPDILASAFLVWSYVRGYEITGDPGYLAEAHRWALSGVPFVYQWSSKPVMPYATIAVYGATNWVAPNWMGLPVQWCGLDYAYALLLLAPYDPSVEWRHLAEGILVAGEQMQITSGPNIGALPDSFDLQTQHPNPWMINPCALISVELLLRGQLDSLAVAHNDQHRVIAPFPVTIKDNNARIDAVKGINYQIIIDAARIIDIHSAGEDIIPLE